MSYEMFFQIAALILFFMLIIGVVCIVSLSSKLKNTEIKLKISEDKNKAFEEYQSSQTKTNQLVSEKIETMQNTMGELNFLINPPTAALLDAEPNNTDSLEEITPKIIEDIEETESLIDDSTVNELQDDIDQFESTEHNSTEKTSENVKINKTEESNQADETTETIKVDETAVDDPKTEAK